MSVAGKRILLIGDSHTVGGYGSTLASLLQQAGAKVTRVAHVGATAADYLTGKYAAEFRTAARQGADILVISLGTNDAAASDYMPVRQSIQNMRSIDSAVGAPVTFWVGPPAFNAEAAQKYNPVFARKDLNARAAELWEEGAAVFKARAIDPREVTRPFVESRGPAENPPRGDIHLGPLGGKAWAQLVLDRVSSGSDVSDAGRPVIPTTITPQPEKGTALGVVAAVAVVLLLRLLWRAKSRVGSGDGDRAGGSGSVSGSVSGLGSGPKKRRGSGSHRGSGPKVGARRKGR
jgi:lysophospholipase L1-like esterase